MKGRFETAQSEVGDSFLHVVYLPPILGNGLGERFAFA